MRGERLIKEIKSIAPFQFKRQDSKQTTYIGVHKEVHIVFTISPSYIYNVAIFDRYGHGDWIKIKASEKYKILQMIHNFYEWYKIHKSNM